MKTKEEVIQEAWGKYWDSFKDKINENGWYDYRGFSEADRRSNYWQFEPLDLEEHPNHSWIRPVSLKGLDYNNGWIKIEKVEDLPKEGEYIMGRKAFGQFTITNDTIEADVCLQNNEMFELWKDFGYTHYRPVVNFEEPIY